MMFKTCRKCHIEKSTTEFHKRSGVNTGLLAWCKDCKNVYTSQWRSKNADKKKLDASNYYKLNSEKVKAASAQWVKENSHAAKKNITLWRSLNKESIRLKASEYQKANPEATRLHNHNYRAKKRLNGGVLSKGLAGKLLILQKGKCACCALPLGDNYHLDHIMPVHLGGTNTDDNIQLLRAICNSQKHSKHPVDFMQSRGFLL